MLALVLCVMIAAAIFLRPGFANADTKTGTVTCTSLRVRTGYGTNYDQLKDGGSYVSLTKGTKVTILDSKAVGSSAWYQVSFTRNGKTLQGYVSGDYIKVEEGSEGGGSSTATGTGTVNVSTLNVRTNYGTSYAKLTHNGKNVTLSKGTKVNILESKKVGSSTWYQVTFSYSNTTLTGYVCGDYVTVTSDGGSNNNSGGGDSNTNPGSAGDTAMNATGTVNANNLRVRTGYGTSNPVLTEGGSEVKLKTGTKVTISATKTVSNVPWYQVTFTWNNKTLHGYVSGQYVTVDQTTSGGTTDPNPGTNTDEGTAFSATGTVNANNLRVRSGYGTSYDPLMSGSSEIRLNTGAKVTISAKKKVGSVDWYHVTFTYGGKTMEGYVSGQYVTLDSENTTDPGTNTDPEPSNNDGETAMSATGKVTTSSLRVRTGYGTDQDQLTYNGSKVSLGLNTKVTISATKKIGSTAWYKVTFTYSGKTLEGYVSGDYVKLDDEEDPGTPGTDPDPVEEPVEQPGMTDEEFDAYLTEQGFPESYKASLRTLHKSHPTWIFKAYQTGLDWNAAIAGENVKNNNLIQNTTSLGIQYKSFASYAYNWSTNKFIVYDGTNWIHASEMAIAYYMDPRTWMNETYIYQFETLSYEMNVQSIKGISAILAGTPLSGSFTYTKNGVTKTTTYAQAILDAAVYSGVNPYHLASRIKQEVISGSSLSGSVTGTYPGYEGYYNFYNIGATSGAGSAIARGLAYAKKTDGDPKYLLPWDNRYDAILGGAYYIGSQYINVGQNTVYLQKYNVTSTKRYGHQYMQNVQAPMSESSKIKQAYAKISEMPLTFSIPVYKNMPASACQMTSIKHPNNWIGRIEVYANGDKVGDAFDKSYGNTVPYVVKVPQGTKQVTVSAWPVVEYTTIEGVGNITLTGQTTEVQLKATAQNGDVKVYTVQIVIE